MTGGTLTKPMEIDLRKLPKPPSMLLLAKHLFQNPLAVFGLIAILVYVFAGLFADVLPLDSPAQMNPTRILEPPSADFLLGTDNMGRDLFSRLIYGIRISFVVAGASVAISTVIGTTVGILSGYFGGIVENVLMRIMDVFFSFPAILLGLAIIAALGPSSRNVILAIAIVYTPIFARVAMGTTRAAIEKQFIEAARATGCRHSRIILVHILPNIQAPIIVQISLALSWALLTEAVFSFLGLGAQPPTPSWGTMLFEGKNYMEFAPWMAIFPGLAVMLAVLGFNLLGDGLRDVLDPQIRNIERKGKS